MVPKTLYDECKEQEVEAIKQLKSGFYDYYIWYQEELLLFLKRNLINFPQYQSLLSSLYKNVNFNDINNYYARSEAK